MAIDPDELYKVMQCAERAGVIEKGTSFAGAMIEKVLEDPEIDLGMLFNIADAISGNAVMYADKALGIMGPFIRFAASDRLMRLVSRILDIKILMNITADMSARLMIMMLKGQKPKLLLRLNTVLSRNSRL